jgi:hypothetical protein
MYKEEYLFIHRNYILAELKLLHFGTLLTLEEKWLCNIATLSDVPAMKGFATSFKVKVRNI